MDKEDLKNCLTAWDDYNGVPVEGSDFYLSWQNKKLIEICEKYGETACIRVFFGSCVSLENLKENQSIIRGGSFYYFLLEAI